MRVLFLGKYDFDDVPGGIERYSKLFLNNLPKEITPLVVYFNVTSETTLTRKADYSVVKVGVWKTIASTAISFSLINKLRDIFKTFIPEIVFIQCPNPMMHLAYLFVPKGRHKLIINWHSDIVRQRVLLKLYQPFVNHLLRKADAVIVHSHELLKSSQLSSCDPGKIHIIPLGVEAPVIKQNAVGKKWGSKFKLFACGRHVRYKGFDLLLKVISQLPDDVVLLLGGTGPETESLKALAKSLRIENRVEFLGFVDEGDLGAYLSSCDVYCFPSISQNEAFGIAQVEAMLLGKPVVGFELFNGTTFVNKDKETGLVVENGNLEQYANAILQLKKDVPFKLKLGLQARKRAEALFDVNAMVSRTVSVFKNCGRGRSL